MQNAVVGFMLVGERTEFSFHHSIELIQQQRQELNGIFRDYMWAFNVMNFMVTKPRVYTEGFCNVLLSSEESLKRKNSVLECRWQAARILEEAPKLASNALHYLRMNDECEKMFGPPGHFLTPKGKWQMTNHHHFSLCLQESAQFVISTIFP